MADTPATRLVTAAQRHQKESRDSTLADIKDAPTLDPTPRINIEVHLKAHEKERARARHPRIEWTLFRRSLRSACFEVARTIGGDEAGKDRSLVSQLCKFSQMIAAANKAELEQPTFKETAKYANKIGDATKALLQLLEGEDGTSYSKFPYFIHIYGNDLEHDSQREFICYLRDLADRAAKVEERFANKLGGPGRAWRWTDAPSAKHLTAAIVIQAWSSHHGKKPSASNQKLWEAADQLWRASGCKDLAKSPEKADSIERWRRTFEDVRAGKGGRKKQRVRK